MANERQVVCRVPGRLADAVEARAQAAGATVADITRAALCREVQRPVDRRSRAFVESWLSGMDAPESAEAEI